MATNVTYKCPTCGAELFWTADKNCFECEYCGDKFSLEDLQASGQGQIDETKVEHHEEVDKQEYAKSNDGTVGNDLVKYTCSHCGAEIITDRATAATICVYCGNAVIMSEQIINDFKPDYIIPFKVKKDAVMKEFKKFSKKPLTPKEFDCEKVVDKLQGVYIPFWLYSGSCQGDFHATGVNVRRWRSGDTEYTEKKYYNVYRNGKVNFERIPVDASSKTENDAMDSIEPFDYHEMTDFNMAYLSGYLAERYDEDQKKCYSRAKERILNSTKDSLRNTCTYDSVESVKFNGNVNTDNPKYALLPTWLLYTTYKDEKYFFAMNGQTGKFIGSLPIDYIKLLIFSLIGGGFGTILGVILGPMFLN